MSSSITSTKKRRHEDDSTLDKRKKQKSKSLKNEMNSDSKDNQTRSAASFLYPATTAKNIKTQPLNDYLGSKVKVLFVGINPGRVSAAHGHHYANPANHFWCFS